MPLFLPLSLYLGRAWTVPELRDKSWKVLHCLWWVCAKERNRIATSKIEHARAKAGSGEYELENRDKTVSICFSFLISVIYPSCRRRCCFCDLAITALAAVYLLLGLS